MKKYFEVFEIVFCRISNLSGCFLLPQNFEKVAEICERYFVSM